MQIAKRVALLLAVLAVPTSGWAVDRETMALRQAYNDVAVRIDSLVRVMGVEDREALDTARLPPATDEAIVPSGHDLVVIFWADDEAKVWINDYFVGETRLTPVEVVVPSLYIKSSNRLRVKCWDTDWVESGFLFGLYLRDASGVKKPILTSDASWEGAGGPVEEIAYAHPLPDIPGAEVIWGERVFGLVEMGKSFGLSDIQGAREARGSDVAGNRREMRYHDFVAQIAALEGERDRLGKALSARSDATTIPATTPDAPGYSLTLGKSGPLEEAVSRPVAKAVDQWVSELPPVDRDLVLPDRRALRGEGAATDVGGRVPLDGREGERVEAYQQPSDRRNAQPGAKQGGRDGAEGDGSGGEGSHEGAVGGGGFAGGRATRYFLLVPTLILAAYVAFAAHQLRGRAV